MVRLDARPTRVIAVDWSGRATGERAHLWLAEVVDGEPGRLWNATRADAAAQLLDIAAADDRLFIGLDFGFSMPAWFLRDHGIGTASELWHDEARLERWLAECRPPFWGRPGRPRPPIDPERPQLRKTEMAAGRPAPKSVFQIGGAGSVGTGSLRGMPTLDRLRRAGCSIWPFDPFVLPVVAEVWPRHHLRQPVVKSNAAARAAYPHIPPHWRPLTNASEDAFDAAVAALGLITTLDSAGNWPTVREPIGEVEGWIWGVPLPSCEV